MTTVSARSRETVTPADAEEARSETAASIFREHPEIRPPLNKKRGLWIGAAAVVAGGALWFVLRGSNSPSPMALPPASVVVAKPLVRDIVEWDDYVGHFRAGQTVDVKPRVPGQIDGIDFKDGG